MPIEEIRDANLPKLPVLILDSGGHTVKHGLMYVEDGHTPAPAPLHPKLIPNATGKLKHQITTLVGDEMDAIHNKNQLELKRPLERGYCVDVGCQLDIWRRVLSLEGIAAASDTNGSSLLFQGVAKGRKKGKVESGKLPASGACVVLLTQPFTPAVVSQSIDETVFQDLGFAVMGKILVQAMAAYRYITQEPKEQSDINDTNLNTKDKPSTTLEYTRSDGTGCACVVDSGFSLTHVVPTYNAKALVS